VVAVGAKTFSITDVAEVVVVLTTVRVVVWEAVVRKVVNGVAAVWVVTVVVMPVATAAQALDKRDGDQETADAGVATSRFWNFVTVVVVRVTSVVVDTVETISVAYCV